MKESERTHVRIARTNPGAGAAALRPSRREEAGKGGSAERYVGEDESPWALLVDAVRSGEYRPLLAAIQHEHRRTDDPAAVITAKLSLLDESVRTVYDGDPRDLPMLLRELDAVRDILLQAATEAPDTALPAPLVGALDRAAGIVPFITTEYAPGEIIRTDTNCDRCWQSCGMGASGSLNRCPMAGG